MTRTAKASPFFLAFLASIFMAVALIVWLALSPKPASNPAKRPLLMYCAVAIKIPIEAIARDYEKSNGVRIELQFGASQTLLTSAAVSHQGDLYLPADDSYIAIAREKNLLADEFPLAIQRLVLVVRRGNPRQIRSLDDLLRPEVKLAQANPDAAASGKVAREILRKAGQWDVIEKQTTVFTTTVVEAANDVKLNTADAAFIWDAMATQYPELQIVPLPALEHAEAKIVVGVLKSSGQPAEAEAFARYLASPAAREYFRKAGFRGNGE